MAKQSDILVLSVKPQVYPAVIKEIRDEVSSEQIIVTIAAGVSMEAAERQFGKEVKIVRVMPNTPALVGEGMSGLCCNEYVTEEEFDRVHKIFESFGKAEKITENLMDAVVGVTVEVVQLCFICLLRQWRMQQCIRDCQESRHIHSLHRHY